MHTTETDIVNILKGCIKQKRSSQKELYTMFYSYSLSICIRYVGNRDQALEIVNDGFMKIFQYLKSFDLDKPFKPWLKRIMINSAIDNFNKTKKYANEIELEEAFTKADDNSVLDEMSYEEMLDLVMTLPNAYRTVFNLIAIEGYKHQEVADMLKISVGTSKSNYARAKKKLQESLKTYFEVDK